MTTLAKTETKRSNSIFKASSKLLREVILKKNSNRHATFYLPTKYISTEIGLAGKLLSKLIEKKTGQSRGFKTFFCNSHLEAIYGSIKIIRHNAYVCKKSEKEIVVLDPGKSISPFFNPLNVSSHNSQAVPGVIFAKTENEVRKIVENNKNIIGVICLLDSLLLKSELCNLIDYCKKKSLITALSEGNIKNWHFNTHELEYNSLADIYIYGENLVNSELPFGAISISDKTYKPWNNIADCLTHSSTFSGNTLPLTYFLCLYLKLNFEELQEHLKAHQKYALDYYEIYINPSISRLYRSAKLDVTIDNAFESTINLSLNKSKKITSVFDCVGGSGCSLRGHNPKDIQEILKNHDSSRDYWSEFSSEIKELTCLDYCLPSVSGASAVDICITMAILAMAPKKAILTFKENYSGKSLLALNFSRFKEEYGPFSPLYPRIIEFDPFAVDAEKDLIKLLEGEDIGLVWFEILQGERLNRIPENILDLLQKNKDTYSYLVGVDEVLTGFFRTGSFLTYQKSNLEPDLVAVGKGMSDLTYPIGAALCSAKVYELAALKNQKLVDRLQSYYLNQQGAQIALNAFKSANRDELHKHALKMEEQFKYKLKPLLSKNSLVKKIHGDGLMLYLFLNENAFVVKLLTPFVVEFLLSSIFLNKAKLHLFNLRLTPAVNISKKNVDEISKKIVKAFSQIKGYNLALFYTVFLLRFGYNKLLNPFRRFKLRNL